jgi:PIN domain nuclease of toxin-antitoxin system
MTFALVKPNGASEPSGAVAVARDVTERVMASLDERGYLTKLTRLSLASDSCADFRVDTGILRRSLLDNGYAELPVTGAHAAALAALPPIHADPFDRMLVAQATAEGLTLVTADPRIAKYPGPIRLV